MGALTDRVWLPVAWLAGWCLRRLRRRGLGDLPRTRAALDRLGLWPILHHYYEPLTLAADLRRPLDQERVIAGLDLDVPGELAFLSRLDVADELRTFPLEAPSDGGFHYCNGSFGAGDAEVFYAVLRLLKPRRLVEVGAGQSTRIARAAIARNTAEGAPCTHVVVEPYEHPWLEGLGVELVRKRLEDCPADPFLALGEGDVLFIDSSHTIRPQGDVVHAYLGLVGQLATGVHVHVHDVFTPRDYPASWVLGERRLWGEQYLLEAFLAYNAQFRVVLALNHLWHHHREAVARACPVLASMPDPPEPGSFWFARR